MYNAIPSSELFSSSLEKVIIAFLGGGRFLAHCWFRRLRGWGVTKSSSLLAPLRGWRCEPAKKRNKTRQLAAILYVKLRKCPQVSLLDLQDEGEGCSLTKGTYFLLASAWPALALELHCLSGMFLLNPALGYGQQTASVPALQPESDGDGTQGKKGKKKILHL